MYMLMTYANVGGETIEYKYCKNGNEYTTGSTDTFVINANYGNIFSPIKMDFLAPPAAVSWPFGWSTTPST